MHLNSTVSIVLRSKSSVLSSKAIYVVEIHHNGVDFSPTDQRCRCKHYTSRIPSSALRVAKTTAKDSQEAFPEESLSHSLSGSGMHTRSVRRPFERPVKESSGKQQEPRLATVPALGKYSRSIFWAFLFGMIVPTTVFLGTVSL